MVCNLRQGAGDFVRDPGMAQRTDPFGKRLPGLAVSDIGQPVGVPNTLRTAANSRLGCRFAAGSVARNPMVSALSAIPVASASYSGERPCASCSARR